MKRYSHNVRGQNTGCCQSTWTYGNSFTSISLETGSFVSVVNVGKKVKLKGGYLLSYVILKVAYCCMYHMSQSFIVNVLNISLHVNACMPH